MKLVVLHSTPTELNSLKEAIDGMKTKPTSIATFKVAGWKQAEIPALGADTTFVLVPLSTPFGVFNSLRGKHDILTLSENAGKFKVYKQWQEADS